MIEKRTQWYHPIQIFDLHAENWVIHRNVDVLWLPDCSYLCCSPLWQFTLDVSTIIFPMITHKHTHTHLFNGKSDQYVRFNARRSFIEQLYFQMNKICAKWCGGLLAIYNLPKRQLRVHWITFGMHVLRVHFNHFRLQIYFNSLFFLFCFCSLWNLYVKFNARTHRCFVAFQLRGISRSETVSNNGNCVKKARNPPKKTYALNFH